MKAGVFDFLKNCSDGYKDRTIKKHCSKCGECCSTLLPLSDEDIDKIKNYLLHHDVQPYQRSKSSNVINMICPFLSEEKKCLIYEVRPLICRVFKCSKKIPQMMDIQLFLAKKLRLSNMWSIFFNNNSANLLCEELANIAKIS